MYLLFLRKNVRNLLKKQVIMVEQMLFLKLPELNQRFALHGSAQDRMQL